MSRYFSSCWIRNASWERKPVRPSAAPKSPKKCAARSPSVIRMRSSSWEPNCLRCARPATSRVSFFELIGGDAGSEILAGYVFDVVGFVEDHGAVVGDDAASFAPLGSTHGSALHGEIGEEQVVVDDDDVARLRALVHGGDEAALELRTLLSGAQLAARVDLGPGGAGFGQRLDFAAVAGFGGLLPFANDAEVGDFFQAVEDGLLFGVVNFLAAGVVAAALHVTGAQRS